MNGFFGVLLIFIRAFVYVSERGVCVGGKLIIEELGRDKEKKRRRGGTMVYVDIRRRTGDR